MSGQQQLQKGSEENAVVPPPPDLDYYIIPARSSWFRWDEVHQTEIDSFPEFFDSISISRNPRVYREYRDFIINKYREDPTRRLTFTDIRKSLVGDAGTLGKVFEFLDHWGLVNFSVSSKVEETLDGVDRGFPTVVVEDGPPNGVRVVANPTVGKGVEILSDVPKKKNKVEEAATRSKFPPLTSYSDVFDVKGGIVPVCWKCGEHCTSGYHEFKKESLIICTKCFGIESDKDLKPDGDLKFANGDSKSGIANDEWTDVETMHLLEAVIAKKNDWALVSDQAQRTKPDCVAKLIQLPLFEHVLNTLNTKSDGRYEIKQSSDTTKYSSDTSKKEHAMVYSNRQIDIERKEVTEEGDDVEPPLKKQCTEEGDDVEPPLKKQCTEEGDDVEPPLKKQCIMSWPDATGSLMRQVVEVSKIAGPHIAASAVEAAIVQLCKESPYARMVFRTENGFDSDFNSFSRNNGINSYNDHIINEGHEMNLQTKTAEENSPEESFGHLAFRTRAAVATAFGCLAAHAKLLSDQEDREIRHLMASIIETQVKKIQCKIKHFVELERMMEKEYVYIQRQKESVLSEWIGILEKANNAGIFKKQTGFSNPVSASTL